jgi:MYXO-CTERM domain-containing protein
MQTFVRGALPPESFLSSGGATPVLSFPATVAPMDAGTTSGPDLDAAVVAPVPTESTPPLPPTAPPQGGCAGCAMGSTDASSAGAIAALMGIALARLRRKKG